MKLVFVLSVILALLIVICTIMIVDIIMTKGLELISFFINSYTATNEETLTPTNAALKPTQSFYESEPQETTIPVVETTIASTTAPTIEVIVTTEPTIPEPTYPPNPAVWYSDRRVCATNEETTHIMGEEINRKFLAQLVYAESGGEDWWCQVYTCSAILNHCEVSGMTLSRCGRDPNHFSVAPYAHTLTPSEMSCEVVEYVLSGGRIEEICYFRTKSYHKFGTPMCKVGAHYFSVE